MNSGTGQIKKSEKKFRPRKQYRYLLGDATANKRQLDLVMYNKHLFKVFNCKPTIDTRAPQMKPLNYIKFPQLFGDSARIRAIQEANKKLVCKINIINRTRGEVDCWNKFGNVDSKWTAKIPYLRKIIAQNKEIYQRLSTATPSYSREEHMQFWKSILATLAETCKYPVIVAKKKTIDELVREQPSISGNFIHYGYQPRVYMDFKVKGGKCIGEIIIELYPDFCPKTVKNFLTYCNTRNTLTYRNCTIYSAKNGKYFETGDVTLNNGKGGTSIYGDSFPEEPSVLRHTRQGVVCSVRIRDRGKLKTNSRFCITVSKAEDLQNRCTVFGKVTKGNHILCKLNNHFKRAGPPYEPIVIRRCGIVPPTKQEIKDHKELQDDDYISEL